MSGFGSQPFGSSPYGIGTPSEAPIPGGDVLRIEATGVLSGSRRIDPQTRDYVLDTNGRVLGMEDTQQLVLMATSTALTSSAMRSLGHRLDTLDIISDSFVRDATEIMEEALAHLVASKQITLLGVDVERLHPGATRIVVRWFDIARDTEHTLEI